MSVRKLGVEAHLTLANLLRQVASIYAAAGQEKKATFFLDAAEHHVEEVTYHQTKERPNDIDTPN